MVQQGCSTAGESKKTSPRPSAYGEVDEAQAAIGLARAQITKGSDLDNLLVQILRDLWFDGRTCHASREPEQA